MQFDGLRTRIETLIKPNSSKKFKILVNAPDIRGHYKLELTIVHEGVFWLEDKGLCSQLLDIKVI